MCHICGCIFDNANAIVAVSTMMHGEYGISDVCLSVPTIVNASGHIGKVLPEMTDEEIAKLRRSAGALKEVIVQINL